MTKTTAPAAKTVAKVATELESATEPLTIAALANRVGLSPTTTRKAVAVLIADGGVRRGDDGRISFDHDFVARHAPEAPMTTAAAQPAALTKSALSKLSREDLFAWANGLALLEHLGPDDMTIGKGALVKEVMGALLRAEVAEEHRAAATDETARPLAELIGFEPPPPAQATKTTKATKAAKSTTKRASSTQRGAEAQESRETAVLDLLGKAGTDGLKLDAIAESLRCTGKQAYHSVWRLMGGPRGGVPTRDQVLVARVGKGTFALVSTQPKPRRARQVVAK